MRNRGVRERKKEAVQVAKQLCYGTDVISKLKAVKTSSEVDRVMLQARKEWQYRF